MDFHQPFLEDMIWIGTILAQKKQKSLSTGIVSGRMTQGRPYDKQYCTQLSTYTCMYDI